MEAVHTRLGHAPLVLAPALRLVRPLLVAAPQDPLIPWPVPQPLPPRQAGISARTRHAVGTLTAALVETLRGRRPLGHLEPHLHPAVVDLVGRLLANGAMPGLRLASLHLSRPAPKVVEAAARLELGAQSRAAALGYARTGTSWRLVAVELSLDDGAILRAA